MQEEINLFWVKALSCEKGLPLSPVVAKFKDLVQTFRNTMPVVGNLRCAVLQERHWAQIHKVLGFEIHNTQNVTFGELIKRKAKDAASAISTITTQAENEEILYKLLKKIQQVREHAEFEVSVIFHKFSLFSLLLTNYYATIVLQVVTYKDLRDVYILTEIDEVILRLDDSMVSINTILGSPYVGAIREDVEGWKDKLGLLVETLDGWLQCQKSWIHLVSIFSAPDIAKQLPTEAKAFRTVDFMWKDLMRRTSQDSNCVRAGTANGLRDTFNQHNATLDKVQKGLDEYLEIKVSGESDGCHLSFALPILLQIHAATNIPQILFPSRCRATLIACQSEGAYLRSASLAENFRCHLRA